MNNQPNIDEYTSELYKALGYSQQQFDRNSLYIASGAFGVSFAFIKDIIPDLNFAKHTNWLLVSWVCFASAIAISLISHFISIKAIRWAIDKKEENQTNKFINTEKKWNRGIRWLNISTIVTIFGGALFLIRFVIINLNS